MKLSTEVLCDDFMLFFMTVKGHMMQLAEEQGLTPVQLAALHALHNSGELAMGQVAEVMHCDASNVTGIVDRLVAGGLITRQESARDRRTKTLRLTDKGAAIVTRVRHTLPRVCGWDALDSTECALLHKIVQAGALVRCKRAEQ